MGNTPLLEPYLQLGFGGLAIALMTLVVWLVKTFVATINSHNTTLVQITKETTEEIGKNTAAIASSFDRVHDVHERQLKTMQDTKDELFKRPCIVKAESK